MSSLSRHSARPDRCGAGEWVLLSAPHAGVDRTLRGHTDAENQGGSSSCERRPNTRLRNIRASRVFWRRWGTCVEVDVLTPFRQHKIRAGLFTAAQIADQKDQNNVTDDEGIIKHPLTADYGMHGVFALWTVLWAGLCPPVPVRTGNHHSVHNSDHYSN